MQHKVFRPFLNTTDTPAEGMKVGDTFYRGNTPFTVTAKDAIMKKDKQGNDKRDGYAFEIKSGKRTETLTAKDKDSFNRVSGTNNWKIAGASALGLGAAAYAYHMYKKTKRQLEEEDRKAQQLLALTSNNSSYNPRSVSTTAISDAKPLSNNVGYQGLSPSNVYARKTASTAIR